MTAAKKLKKLEARLSPAGLAGLVETVDSYEAKKELAGVLPQIVAAIEAAEELQGVAGGVIWLNNNMHMYGNDEWRGYFKAVLRDARRGYESAAALAALDEQLGDIT